MTGASGTGKAGTPGAQGDPHGPGDQGGDGGEVRRDERDPLDEVISLAEAAQLCGLSPHTLTLQAEKGKLRARKLGHTWVTTRHWTDVYVAEHGRRGKHQAGHQAGHPPDNNS